MYYGHALCIYGFSKIQKISESLYQYQYFCLFISQHCYAILKIKTTFEESLFQEALDMRRYTYLVLGTHGSHFDTNTHESWIQYTKYDTCNYI
jgi:hypothetical protein